MHLDSLHFLPLPPKYKKRLIFFTNHSSRIFSTTVSSQTFDKETKLEFIKPTIKIN